MKPTTAPIPSQPHQNNAMAPAATTQNSLLQQAASDLCRSQSLRAREILASSNTPTAVLPLLQQGSLPLSIGNGFGSLQQQPNGQPVDLSALFNGFMGVPQAAGNPLQYQLSAQPPGAQFLGQAPQNAQQINIPPAALALNNMQSFMGGNHQRPAPTNQEVQDALATIAAATGAPVAGGAGRVDPAPPPEKPPSAVAAGGHAPTIVYMECDEESLSDYQCLLRKQIELFEATPDDVQWNAQGRNKAIVLGQVGIRCRYCSTLPTWSRARGAVYYSATLDGLYQAAQNMAKNHLCRHCRLIPEDTRGKLISLRDCKRRAAGGKKYWAEGARVLGVIQASDGLRFRKSKQVEA